METSLSMLICLASAAMCRTHPTPKGNGDVVNPQTAVPQMWGAERTPRRKAMETPPAPSPACGGLRPVQNAPHAERQWRPRSSSTCFLRLSFCAERTPRRKAMETRPRSAGRCVCGSHVQNAPHAERQWRLSSLTHHSAPRSAQVQNAPHAERQWRPAPL